ncbi:unnamed protein product [Owenia fusiformis]|uniref:Uncharacterized protein n=1 Tax=Owenia fusiformis TaxID=6347 RepID=A0A8J1ULJ3_OWEFU|nr:unnamed protein product [Owenia fusiformis]
MSWCLSPVVCITLIIPYVNGESWVTANHGTPPVFTGLAPMKSGWSTKLFGVGNKYLQERYYSSGWIWANHWEPWGLQAGEHLASEPCVMYDGKLFIVSNYGRLFERYWSSGWQWSIHGKAPGSPNAVTLRPMCACKNIHGGRVFVVGTNFKLYERWWSYSSNSWQWRYHGSPPGTSIGPSAIDTCTDSGCTEIQVYLVAGNGYVYSRYITAANPGTPSWYLVGKPSGKTAHSVRVSGGGLFVTTVDNYVCERLSSTNWICSRPSSTTSTPYRSTTLSKAVQVNNCPQLGGSAKYLFVNNWDGTTTTGGWFFIKPKPVNIRGKLWRLKVSGMSHNWVYHGTAAPCCYYHRPTIFMSGSCPKAFFVKSNGNVLEKYLP